MNKPIIKTNLKAILEYKGISARELARRTGVHRESIRRLVTNETKQYTGDVLAIICKELGVTIDELLIYLDKESR